MLLYKVEEVKRKYFATDKSPALFGIIFYSISMEVAGGLVVKALDCRSKSSKVPVPLETEQVFFVFFRGGDGMPSVLWNPLELACVLLGFSR